MFKKKDKTPPPPPASPPADLVEVNCNHCARPVAWRLFLDPSGDVVGACLWCGRLGLVTSPTPAPPPPRPPPPSLPPSKWSPQMPV